MKQLALLIMLLVGSVLTFAQNDTVLYIANEPDDFHLCVDHYDRIVVYAETGCQSYQWFVVHDGNVNGDWFDDNPLILNVSDYFENSEYVEIRYRYGCSLTFWNFEVEFHQPAFPTSSTQTIWKRLGETMTIEPVGTDSLTWYEYQWSTGATTSTIDVTEPGTYTCQISDFCGTATRTFIVRDNVEIYRSGVDPATNKNRVLWQTTPEQAAYVSSVKVERDGMVVGTVPYSDGEFLDNIGSENAARIYRITAIASDGTECPIPSYQFGTFNTIISPDIANPSLMNFTWEDPFIEEGSPYSVVAYRIGRFNESTGEFVAIDQLSAQVHLGKYNMDLFDGDYGIVAAVFNDVKNRDYEELAFSNRSDSGIVGIGEQNSETFGIYPNPAKDRFIVEGSGIMTVMNTLGQTVLTQEIDGKTTIELPQGLYFVKLGGAMRKVVVE